MLVCPHPRLRSSDSSSTSALDAASTAVVPSSSATQAAWLHPRVTGDLGRRGCRPRCVHCIGWTPLLYLLLIRCHALSAITLLLLLSLLPLLRLPPFTTHAPLPSAYPIPTPPPLPSLILEHSLLIPLPLLLPPLLSLLLPLSPFQPRHPVRESPSIKGGTTRRRGVEEKDKGGREWRCRRRGGEMRCEGKVRDWR